MLSFDSDINIARQEFKRVLIPLIVGICAGGVILFLLSGCGFGQIGPETQINADTPCGHIDYHSTKDQAAPSATCTIGRDGEKFLEIGSAGASGAGIIANALGQSAAAIVRLTGGK